MRPRVELIVALVLGASCLGHTTPATVPPSRIVVWTGYGTPARAVVHGRVIADPPASVDVDAGLFENLAQNLDTLESDEVAFAAVEVRLGTRRIGLLTDEDGVFRAPLELAPLPLEPGNHAIEVRLVEKDGAWAAPAAGVVRIVDDGPGLALLSDFDDTVALSHVTNKPHLLYEVLAKNAAQLAAVPGASDAYQAASRAGVDIFFYLSGSPIQLYERIDAFLGLQGFPPGPLLLKNLGDDPLFAQLDYKVARIEALLDAVPNLRFIFVGDSGEKDPEVYSAVRAAHPARVAAIVIRRAPGADDAPARFTGMTVVDDYRGKTELLADLTTQARRAR